MNIEAAAQSLVTGDHLPLEPARVVEFGEIGGECGLETRATDFAVQQSAGGESDVAVKAEVEKFLNS